MLLHNRVNKNILKKELQEEKFNRKTISFYKYFRIDNPQDYRDKIYQSWSNLQCFGRIYIAHEGVNAQMSIPEYNLNLFLDSLNLDNNLKDVPIKYAIEDDGKSFYKLTIKVKTKIVADGLSDDTYDVSNVGTHLTAMDFHNQLEDKNTIVVDMRNHYESEVGRFDKAYCPDADTFREAIEIVDKTFEDRKDKTFLLYCTGGIRCEKASAYLKHKGYKNVNQLYGGIIEYAQQIKQKGLESKFIGKNFVIDERLGESIDNTIIARCHQCGNLCDTHTNCANDDCHLLFIQCKSCAEKHDGCCSNDCKNINQLPEEEKKKMRKERHTKYANSKIFKSRLRPRLQEIASIDR